VHDSHLTELDCFKTAYELYSLLYVEVVVVPYVVVRAAVTSGTIDVVVETLLFWFLVAVPILVS